MRSPILNKLLLRLTRLRDKSSHKYKSIDYPHSLIRGLFKLDLIVGLEKLKVSVYEIINLAISEKSRGVYRYGENNIILTGKPGCGKTTVASIIGEILNALGVHKGCYKNNRSTIPIKSEPNIQGLPFDIINQINRDRIRSLQSTSQSLRKSNTLYQAYIQDISDTSHVQMGLLKESLTYLERYIKQPDKEDFLTESKSRLQSAEKHTKSIIEMVNSFDENLKKLEKTEKSPLREILPKNSLGKISVDIWGEINVEKEFVNHYRHCTWTDLVGSYVGSTGPKTREALKNASGGVIFIDEAYALTMPNGSSDNHSSSANYGQEAVTEMTNYITQEPGSIVIILAGYADQLHNNIFAKQDGLSRRFPRKIKLDDYTSEELSRIFIEMIGETGWTFNSSVNVEGFFLKHKDEFPGFGGDCQILTMHCRNVMADLELEVEELSNSMGEEVPVIQITEDILEKSVTKCNENRHVYLKEEDKPPDGMYN